MTSKLKCPFCQQELELDDILGNSQPLYYCKNRNCERTKWLSGTSEFWQALIQAKQDLEVARKGLILAKWWLGSNCIASAEKAIDKALKQIEQKE